MSATDWYPCPSCKEKALQEINKIIDKLSPEDKERMTLVKKKWEDPYGELDEIEPLYDFLRRKEGEHKGFNADLLMGDDWQKCTVRYDSDTTLTGEGIIDMNEVYSCQICTASWIIKKKWKKGTNREV